MELRVATFEMRHIFLELCAPEITKRFGSAYWGELVEFDTHGWIKVNGCSVNNLLGAHEYRLFSSKMYTQVVGGDRKKWDEGCYAARQTHQISTYEMVRPGI